LFDLAMQVLYSKKMVYAPAKAGHEVKL